MVKFARKKQQKAANKTTTLKRLLKCTRSHTRRLFCREKNEKQCELNFSLEFTLVDFLGVSSSAALFLVRHSFFFLHSFNL